MNRFMIPLISCILMMAFPSFAQNPKEMQQSTNISPETLTFPLEKTFSSRNRTNAPFSFRHYIENKSYKPYQASFLPGTSMSIRDESAPFFIPYPERRKHHPDFSNYNISQEYRISTRSSFIGNSERAILPGLGEYLTLKGILRWKMSGNLSISAGGLLNRQFHLLSPSSRQDITAMTLQTRYHITRDLQLTIRGQYLFQNVSYPSPVHNALFTRPGASAALTLKLKNMTQISGCTEYQFNESDQKWKLESTGRVTIGF